LIEQWADIAANHVRQSVRIGGRFSFDGCVLSSNHSPLLVDSVALADSA
jgi:hypothetical protein